MVRGVFLTAAAAGIAAADALRRAAVEIDQLLLNLQDQELRRLEEEGGIVNNEPFIKKPLLNTPMPSAKAGESVGESPLERVKLPENLSAEDASPPLPKMKEKMAEENSSLPPHPFPFPMNMPLPMPPMPPMPLPPMMMMPPPMDPRQMFGLYPSYGLGGMGGMQMSQMGMMGGMGGMSQMGMSQSMMGRRGGFWRRLENGMLVPVGPNVLPFMPPSQRRLSAIKEEEIDGYLSSSLGGRRRANDVPSPSLQETVCCQDCLPGDLRCLARCQRDCTDTAMCAEAGSGAHAGFCQKSCSSPVVFSMLAPGFTPVTTCERECVNRVREMCERNNCVEYGCVRQPELCFKQAAMACRVSDLRGMEAVKEDKYGFAQKA